MESSEEVTGKEVARHMDISQGEIVSAVGKPTYVNVLSGGVFIAGDHATVNQIGSPHCKPYTKTDISELKEKYKIKYEKHEIHKVDVNHRIILEEVKVGEFAVKLKISNPNAPAPTFRDETRRHFEDLKGTKSRDIELSGLVNNNKRVTFIRGIAGMGKSVLSKQLTYYWAQGGMYSNFTLCIMFECRDINYFVTNEGAELKKHELVGEFLKSKFSYDLQEGKGVLFIADGLDELYDVSADDSVIWQLLDVNISKYAKSKIIITGRPHVETSLSRHGRRMGGLWKVEIQGLSDSQIEDYVKKFATRQEDFVNICKAKDSSKRQLPILNVPQFLNSFCCVAILSEGETVRNAAELYCWTLYLLLKQHAEKEGLTEKLSFQVFNEHATDMRALSKICHELLSKNKIVVEGNIKSLLCRAGQKKEFLEGLFVDVSDSRRQKFQFKHLTLMEFLSAIHCCSITDHMESIRQNLKSEFYEALLFSCQLFAGCTYDGIIRDMLENIMDLKAIDLQNFLPTVLNLVRQCINSDNILLQLSIDIIMCFANENVASKQLIISNAKNLHFGKHEPVRESIAKLSQFSEQLLCEYDCSTEDIQEAFENVHFTKVVASDITSLAVAKYLKNIEDLELCEMNVDASISVIRKEVSAKAKWRKLEIWKCKFEDEGTSETSRISRVESVELQRCRLSKSSFINLCDWGTSSFGDFTLWDMDIEEEWWQELVDAVVKKNINSGDLTLKRLDIGGCTPEMNEELQKKVETFAS